MKNTTGMKSRGGSGATKTAKRDEFE